MSLCAGFQLPVYDLVAISTRQVLHITPIFEATNLTAIRIPHRVKHTYLVNMMWLIPCVTLTHSTIFFNKIALTKGNNFFFQKYLSQAWYLTSLYALLLLIHCKIYNTLVLLVFFLTSATLSYSILNWKRWLSYNLLLVSQIILTNFNFNLQIMSYKCKATSEYELLK